MNLKKDLYLSLLWHAKERANGRPGLSQSVVDRIIEKLDKMEKEDM